MLKYLVEGKRHLSTGDYFEAFEDEFEGRLLKSKCVVAEFVE